MLFPIAHERMSATRVPIVTIALFFGCIVAYGLESRSPEIIARYGFVPRAFDPITLVSYAFLHSGLVHLVGNVWLLLLLGFNVEDRWGRGPYLLFYAGGAVVGALAHKLFAWDSATPLIGASAAIAAIMAAFVVLFRGTRIHVAYFAIVRAGTFAVPASTLFFLWVAIEALFAVANVGDGVAHAAHVGGFAYGLVIALVTRAIAESTTTS